MPERPAAAPATAKAARPGWLVAVWLATLGYLVIELSFNARLLDVVGGNASPQEVDRIEIWGRLISGFALALFGWPRWIRQARSRHSGTLRRIRHVAWWSLLAMLAMYIAQESIIRSLVNSSSEAQLAQAQHLVLLRNGLHEGLVELPGLEVDGERLTSAEGKALLAMFPMLASGLGDLIGTRFDAGQRERVTGMLVTRRMGDPNLHLDGYRDLVQAIHDGYVQYGEALAEVDRQGAEAWSKYTRDLRRRGYRPNSVPRRGHAQVRRNVRASGVYVASDWRPGDRAGFVEAATRDGRLSARREFSARMAAESPAFAGVSPPDTFDEFMRGEDTQPRILSALGYSCLEKFDPDIGTADAFMANLYQAEADCQTQRVLARHGEEEAGRDARRLLLVPIIALFLSLLGGLAHIGKMIYLTRKLVLGRQRPEPRWALVIALGPPALLLLIAWIPLGKITSQQLYRSLEADLPKAKALVMRSTIHGQHLGYPLFDGVRVHAMRGFTFGYQDDEQQRDGGNQSDSPRKVEQR